MKNVSTFIVIIVVIILTLFIQHRFFPTIEIIEKTDTVIEYKTINTVEYRDRTKIETIYVKEPADTIYIPSDTTELIARYKALWTNYYRIKGYEESFLIDTVGHAIIGITVTQNRLDSITFKSSILIPEKTITKVVIPKNSFYLGGLIGRNNVSPILLYSYKNKYSGFVGYNVVEGGIQVGALVNINSFKIK